MPWITNRQTGLTWEVPAELAQSLERDRDAEGRPVYVPADPPAQGGKAGGKHAAGSKGSAKSD